LDKEFFTVEMINYLQNRKTPFIMPCVKRGPSGGIRKLFKGKKSYSTEYTMTSKENEATFQVNVVVKYSKGKYNRNGVEYFAYAVYNTDLPIKNTFKEYRKRFGIESSYRIMNQGRIHTSTKKPALRLLYVGLSLLLVNIWIYIQWTYLSIPRQGGRRKVTWTFKTMLKQINRTTEELLGFNYKITIKKLTKL
jgi:putative transposase